MSEQTFSFLKNPYGFIAEEAKRRKTKVFETRLLLRKTICMTGPEAAAIFYNPEFFVRKNAAPFPIKASLFGSSGLQNLDGVAHRRRKEMLLEIFSPERSQELGIITREMLRLQSVAWSLRSEINLYHEVRMVMTEAVCQWAGIPIEGDNIEARTQELMAPFDRSRMKMGKAEDWITKLIHDVREGRLIPEDDSVLGIISSFKDHRSQLLTARMAAAEVLNVLRPAVATSVYMVFVAHALSIFQDEAPDLKDERSIHNFIQEVRRYYPFFPPVSAKVKKNFVWKNMKFTRGERAILDVFGTNHDSQFWVVPEDFYPDRFKHNDLHPFSFIPQGGGDAMKTHRCPGEEATIEIMKQMLLFLSEDLDYTVPSQDLMLDFAHVPALPKSHFRMAVVNLNFLRSDRHGPESYYTDSSYHFSHQ